MEDGCKQLTYNSLIITISYMNAINILSFFKKGIILLIGGLMLLTGCNKCNEKNNGPDITGEWELVSSSSLTDSKINVRIFIKFDSGAGKFEIFQKLGEGHFRKLTGTYSFSGNIMSGTYSDGVAFNCNWETAIDGDTLTMKSTGNDNLYETNVYKRCTIPEDVIQDAEDYSPVSKVWHDFRPL